MLVKENRRRSVNKNFGSFHGYYGFLQLKNTILGVHVSNLLTYSTENLYLHCQKIFHFLSRILFFFVFFSIHFSSSQASSLLLYNYQKQKEPFQRLWYYTNLLHEVTQVYCVEAYKEGYRFLCFLCKNATKLE